MNIMGILLIIVGAIGIVYAFCKIFKTYLHVPKLKWDKRFIFWLITVVGYFFIFSGAILSSGIQNSEIEPKTYFWLFGLLAVPVIVDRLAWLCDLAVTKVCNAIFEALINRR